MSQTRLIGYFYQKSQSDPIRKPNILESLSKLSERMKATPGSGTMQKRSTPLTCLFLILIVKLLNP